MLRYEKNMHSKPNPLYRKAVQHNLEQPPWEHRTTNRRWVALRQLLDLDQRKTRFGGWNLSLCLVAHLMGSLLSFFARLGATIFGRRKTAYWTTHCRKITTCRKHSRRQTAAMGQRKIHQPPANVRTLKNSRSGGSPGRILQMLPLPT